MEVRPSPRRPGAFEVTDPSGIAPGRLTLSAAMMFIVSKMDGRHRRADIQAEFTRHFGTMLFSDDLDRLIRQLDQARFLLGSGFDEHMAEVTRRYRNAPCRPIRDKNALGAPPDQLGAAFDKMLATAADHDAPADGRIVGLVAPHLDYARGAPCYAAAYRNLADRTQAARFVILGANHFGRPSAAVGTRKDFETLSGVVPHDEAFMRRLDERCGTDLCELEYDHLREHSIELQVLLLQHVLDGRAFTIAPFLCSDPCGHADASPDDEGVALNDFAAALRAEIEADETPTCIIAAADLSHVGRFFQDPRDLDAQGLRTVEDSDRRVLACVEESNPDLLRARVTATDNATNICSIGCLYALSAALKDRARPRLLQYHQAVVKEAQNCVTCAAFEFTRE